MAEYRIIKNRYGFYPQRHRWYGWDNFTRNDKFNGEIVRCGTVAEARAAIDENFKQRCELDEHAEGAEIETYQPKLGG